MTSRSKRRTVDVSERLGPAVDYIEEHLGAALSLDAAARQAGFSRWHFMRLFHLVFGMPAAEYVRRRRLARAAEALEDGRPVLEVALECGYESQASFTRAFAKTFGVTPGAYARQVRRGEASLELLGPVEPRTPPFEIGPAGDPALVHKPGFRAVGMTLHVSSRRYQPFRDVPAFWAEWFSRQRWRPVASEPGVSTYGLARADASGDLEYVIAVEAAPGAPVPQGYRAVQVEAGLRAVFSGVGPPAATIQALTMAAYGHWLSGAGARRRRRAWDVEAHIMDPSLPRGSMRCELWIPLAPERS